jgi:hypothetical protein
MIVHTTKYNSRDKAMNEMGESFSTYWGEETCIKGLVGKPEFKRQLVRPTRRWGIILKWIFKNLRGGFGLD